MQFNITGKHVEVSEALRTHIEGMLQRLEASYPQVTSAQVTVSIEKHEKVAEATLHVAGSNDVHGGARHEDMYQAVNLLEEKIERQLHKLKEKHEQF